jgi:hypothetical protein
LQFYKGGETTHLLFGEGRLERDTDGLEKFVIALGTDLKQTVNPLISLQVKIYTSET